MPYPFGRPRASRTPGLIILLAIVALSAVIPAVRAATLPETIPGSVYGIVLEPKDTKKGPVNVTLQWTDSNGVVWEAKVRTLLPSEVQALKAQQEGNRYDGGTIDTQTGSTVQFLAEGLTIELSAKPKNESSTQQVAQVGGTQSSGQGGTSGQAPGEGTGMQSGQRVSAGDGSQGEGTDGTQPGSANTTTAGVEEGLAPEGRNDTTEAAGEQEEGGKESVLTRIVSSGKGRGGIIALAIAGIALLGGGTLYLSRRKHVEGPAKPADPEKGRIEKLIAREVPVVKDDDAVERAIHLLTTEQLTCLPVLEGKEVVGLITLRDIIAKAHLPNLKKLKAKEVMSEARGVSADATVMEAIEILLSNRLEELPVLSKKRLVGMVTQRALLEELDRYFASIEFKTAIPGINDMMHQHIIIPPDLKMRDVVKEMAENAGPVEVREVGVIVGLITEREVVNEIYHEQNLFPKLPAEQVMSKNNFILGDTRDIVGANNLMLDHTSYWSRILSKDQPVGAITTRELFEALVSLFKSQRAEERKGGAKKG